MAVYQVCRVSAVPKVIVVCQVPVAFKVKRENLDYLAARVYPASMVRRETQDWMVYLVWMGSQASQVNKDLRADLDHPDYPERKEDQDVPDLTAVQEAQDLREKWELWASPDLRVPKVNLVSLVCQV